jgi:positive regulator of sigma E activity
MKRFTKYFTWSVILLYFVLGIYILASSRFTYLSKEIRVIFAVFLFLYGGFRIARLWTRYREEREEEE